MKYAWWCRSRSSRRRSRPSCSPGWPSCAGRRRPRTPQGCLWRQRSSSGGLPRQQLVASCCRWRDCGISEWLTSLIKDDWSSKRSTTDHGMESYWLRNEGMRDGTTIGLVLPAFYRTKFVHVFLLAMLFGLFEVSGKWNFFWELKSHLAQCEVHCQRERLWFNLW